MKPTRTDASNRGRITLVAFVLIALGALTLLMATGVFGGRRESAVLDSTTQEFLSRPWVPWAGLAICLLLLLVAAHWLLIQLRTGTVRGFPLEQRRQGRVYMPAHALTDAFAEDAKRVPGVATAKASLRGQEEAPTVNLRVDLEPSADLGVVRAAVESEAVTRLREAINRPLAVDVEYRLPTSAARAIT